MIRQHPYIPATDAEEREMLEAMGVQSFEELIRIIPDELRAPADLQLGSGLSEMELEKDLERLAAMNHPATEGACFLGGGAYDRYVPAAVRAVASRSEFYTAYTPYQAEVSQGTLQALYEFQTMICEISGLDVANASMYDGASAAAEACSMALGATGLGKILIPENVHPNTQAVITTYLQNRPSEIIPVGTRDGLVDLDDLRAKSADAAAVLVQSPNYLGLVEDWSAARNALIEEDTLLIASADPVSLGLLESPGASGADVYVGEGQSLGIPLSYGGPYLGLFAAREKYTRRLPGRIVGRTVDLDGNPGFVMVLRTREQDIRREKATSNICTNQSLMALWSALYLTLLGKQGLPALAGLCFQKSHYLADKIGQLPGCELPFGQGFFTEFAVRTPHDATLVRDELERDGLHIGTVTWKGETLLQIAVTEKRTRDQMDHLVTTLERIVT